MMTLNAIRLETDWFYHFARNKKINLSAPTIDETGWIPLPEISDWAVTNAVQSGADWFRRRLIIRSTNVCVRYVLHIEHIPENVEIYLNGRFVGSSRGTRHFKVDVTDFVFLGANLLAMKLTCETNTAGGGFGLIRLQPIECD